MAVAETNNAAIATRAALITNEVLIPAIKVPVQYRYYKKIFRTVPEFS
jgi:hypothetical protein